jgi:hypothetical protein
VGFFFFGVCEAKLRAKYQSEGRARVEAMDLASEKQAVGTAIDKERTAEETDRAPEFVEFSDALSADEVAALNDSSPGAHNNSFSFYAKNQDVVKRLTLLCQEADRIAGWQLVPSNKICTPTDPMMYNRFGTDFSDRDFSWHCDAGKTDSRLISIVAYLTEPDQFEGGTFEMKVDDTVISRRYRAGYAVAFPSKQLEHRVTPVTKGTRRSLVLICGASNANGEPEGLFSWP